MENKVGRDGEAGSWDGLATPASAKSYYFRVFKTVYPSAGLRNMRELHSLCTALDHLAMGRSRSAADLIAQRIKALERAIVDGHWTQAQYLEVLEPDDTTLLTRDEEYIVTQETELQQRLRGKGAAWGDKGAGAWKGAGWKGQKGEKGGKDGRKGKGKGKGQKDGKAQEPPQ